MATPRPPRRSREPAADPVDRALARARAGEPEAFEASVVRGALEIPGVLGGLLLSRAPDGNLTPVASAGTRPPAEEEANAARAPRDRDAGRLVAVSLEGWEAGPAWKLVLAVDPAAPRVRQRLERYAALAAPLLAASSEARRNAEACRRLAEASDEIAVLRRARRERFVEGLVGRLAGRVASELADPLGAVLGATRALAESSDDGVRSLLVGDLVDASGAGRDLVEQLAALGSLEEGAAWGPISIAGAIEEGIEAAAPAARAAGASIERRLAAGLPELDGNGALLRLACRNALVALAEAFEDEGPRSLRVEAEATEEGIALRLGCRGACSHRVREGRWPASAGGRMGWWIAREIFLAHGAKARSGVAEDGAPFLDLLLPTVGRNGRPIDPAAR